MMFMMPMPPTTKEMADGEVVGAAGRDAVRAAQQIGDFGGRQLRLCLRRGGRKQHVEVGDARESLLHSGVRHQSNVVLVFAHAILTFFLQYANDGHGNAAKTDGLTDGVLSVGEQRLNDGLADDTHLGIAFHVVVGKHSAFG